MEHASRLFGWREMFLVVALFPLLLIALTAFVWLYSVNHVPMNDPLQISNTSKQASLQGIVR